ncbi:metal-dependent hydrolase [Rubrivirga sp. IMCC43871]|uniref:metal-dependent hydrolase n=1 Tax=Rubrivirga sp. IMCC43871 TaxID=3391575 RepID=UPI003990105A
MAGYKGHLAGATVFFGVYLAGLALVYAVDEAYLQFSELELIAYPIALFGLCLMFGLWPDVDTNSKGQNLFYALFFLADVALIATEQFQEAAYLGLFCILPALGKHRGWTHTYWAMVLIPSPLLALPYMLTPERPLAGLPFYLAAVVGYFSHLVMDGLVFRLPGRRKSAGW